MIHGMILEHNHQLSRISYYKDIRHEQELVSSFLLDFNAANVRTTTR